MATIQLPDGRRFDPAGWSWTFSSSIITFTSAAGGSFTYQDANNNALNAAAVLLQIDNFVASGANSVGAIQASGLIISSISPASFDITTGVLTVIGYGFSAATLGTLRFEDTAGGQDSNGYYDNLTYVSPNQMTAAYGGPGDGGLSSAMIIYYLDSTGQTSNNINATNPSGTLITIP